MFHLDTNFLVRVQIAGSTEETRYDELVLAGEAPEISAVAWGEYLCGPLTRAEEAAARNLVREVEPLLEADAELAAKLFNATGRRSRTFADCMIAAVALRCGAKLATSNTADFSPFEPHGLVLA